ncbi:MAG: hypothetical protein WCK02_11760 [Bacteroidota bacterium]
MRNLLLIFVLFIPFIVSAQNNDTISYDEWDESEDMAFSFSIPAATFSKIDNINSYSLGGSLNVYINKHWFVGVFGERMSNSQLKDITIDTINYTKLRLGYGIITPAFGYIFFPQKKINIYAGLRFGWGGHSLIEGQSYVYSKKIVTGNSTIIEPNIDFLYTLAPAFKLAVGLGYRYNTKFKNIVYTNKNFNSAYLSVSLLFGSFPE